MTVLATGPTLAEEVAALLIDRVPAGVLDRVLVELEEAGRDTADEDLRTLLAVGTVGGRLYAQRSAAWHLVGVRTTQSSRLLSRLRLQASAFREELLACRAADTLWLLLSTGARPWAAQVAEAAGELELLAVGTSLKDLRLAPAHRASLDELLAVGERRGWTGIADTRRLEAAARVEALLDLAARQPALLDGALDVLFDDPANAGYAHTLCAWFENDQDAAATAAQLHLHVNTVRYRLRRAQEITGVDLSDWDQRLVAQVQLRMWRDAGRDAPASLRSLTSAG